jgi:glycosyltransferase involved in cell wall biosynthesis
MTDTRRFAIVTPYYREDRELLDRCLESVGRQTVPTDHFVVADGFPQDWLDTRPVRHFKLDRSHADYGNTPRGVVALLAAAEGYDGIGLLDADNWLHADHIEHCLEVAAEVPHDLCDIVFAQRNYMRPDGTKIDLPGEPFEWDIDTNCFFFLPGSYHTLFVWALMPKQVAPLCDKFFFNAIRRYDLVYAATRRQTVNYHCLWEDVYRSAGEAPPPGAKPLIPREVMGDWMQTSSRRDIEIVGRLFPRRQQQAA